MDTLPDGLVHYKSTQTFNEKSIPKALLNEHSTKRGVWGKIVVEFGSLKYTVCTSPSVEMELNIARSGVIEPETKHYVTPLGPVQFHVEFYKRSTNE